MRSECAVGGRARRAADRPAAGVQPGPAAGGAADPVAPLIENMRPLLRNVLGPGIEKRFELDDDRCR
jgi:hypothetical protein